MSVMIPIMSVSQIHLSLKDTEETSPFKSLNVLKGYLFPQFRNVPNAYTFYKLSEETIAIMFNAKLFFIYYSLCLQNLVIYIKCSSQLNIGLLHPFYLQCVAMKLKSKLQLYRIFNI